jgi:hypothetical protein
MEKNAKLSKWAITKFVVVVVQMIFEGRLFVMNGDGVVEQASLFYSERKRDNYNNGDSQR